MRWKRVPGWMGSMGLCLCVSAEARQLTIDEALALATRHNPQLAALAADRDRAAAESRSARGRLLPSVAVSDQYLHWNSPYAIPFAPGATGTTPASASVQVRNADTNFLTVTATQPLVGLLYRSQDLLAGQESAEAAGAAYQVGVASLRQNVEVGFLRYFEAHAQEEIARASQTELGQQARIAEARVRAGVSTRSDLLRVQVAAQNAEQQALTAHTQGLVTLANLLIALGLPGGDSSVELVEPSSLLASGSEPGPYQSLSDQALRRRPEISRVEHNAEANDHAARSRLYSLLPELSATAFYQRTDGQLFQPPNAAAVGGTLQWNLWEWGATYYQYRAAAARAEAAHANVEAERLQVSADVASSIAGVTQAISAISVARRAIDSAGEAYRETDAQLRAGTATTTDLISAEAALTQARLNLATARYERAIAEVALRRAVGD